MDNLTEMVEDEVLVDNVVEDSNEVASVVETSEDTSNVVETEEVASAVETEEVASGLVVKDGSFELNGQSFKIYSGAMHYFRIPDGYWQDRLSKLKAAGFNTVETYCAWNMHEPREGEFNWSGMADVARFVKTAQDIGLYVIVRPGPYICAEWNFGGFPAWLMKDKNLRLRCNDEKYLGYVERYYSALMEQLRPYLAVNGGNIIGMQVENEYGSYGNDKKYLRNILAIMKKVGMDTFLFTSDGDCDFMLYGGTLPEVLPTVNFGSNAPRNFGNLRKLSPMSPKMCMEFWCGWFDHFGEKHHVRGSESILKELNSFKEQDASFNFYMFHGGTNFGFGAGSNYAAAIAPTVTSYDYCAPLNEYGDYTPSYYKIRDFMHELQGIEKGELPHRPELQHIGEVMLTERASLWDNLDNIGEKHYSPMPEPMEYYGQNDGLIYYETKVEGKHEMQWLQLCDLNDRAYVYFNDKFVAKFENPLVSHQQNIFKRKRVKKRVLMPTVKKGIKIGVLVDAFGRVNYGLKFGTDRKGITGIKLNNSHYFMDYEVTTLPLDNIDKVDYSAGGDKYPIFLRGTFKTYSQADCFVDTQGFTKGYIFVNGHNLGRYWNIGPQRTLYLPGIWLKEGENEIVVLELEKVKEQKINISDKHFLSLKKPSASKEE